LESQNNFTRLHHDLYNQGYAAGIRAVLETIENIQIDLKRHKRRQSVKTYVAILKCMLDCENTAKLREIPGAFVRCTDKNDCGYEVYIDRRWQNDGD
jgi:hypothetical protein